MAQRISENLDSECHQDRRAGATVARIKIRNLQSRSLLLPWSRISLGFL